jgi:hypothetical protein
MKRRRPKDSARDRLIAGERRLAPAADRRRARRIEDRNIGKALQDGPERRAFVSLIISHGIRTSNKLLRISNSNACAPLIVAHASL